MTGKIHRDDRVDANLLLVGDGLTRAVDDFVSVHNQRERLI